MSCKDPHAFCRLNTINRALKLPDEIICAMAAVRVQRSRTCDFIETVQETHPKTVFAILAMPEKCEAGHQCKRKISTLCKGRKGMRHPNSFPPLNE
jgi:hypothetical protein